MLISTISHASLIVRLLNSEAEATRVEHLFVAILKTMLADGGGPLVSSA